MQPHGADAVGSTVHDWTEVAICCHSQSPLPMTLLFCRVVTVQNNTCGSEAWITSVFFGPQAMQGNSFRRGPDLITVLLDQDGENSGMDFSCDGLG
jgi:hypothetical protein